MNHGYTYELNQLPIYKGDECHPYSLPFFLGYVEWEKRVTNIKRARKPRPQRVDKPSHSLSRLCFGAHEFQHSLCSDARIS